MIGKQDILDRAGEWQLRVTQSAFAPRVLD